MCKRKKIHIASILEKKVSKTLLKITYPAKERIFEAVFALGEGYFSWVNRFISFVIYDIVINTRWFECSRSE